MKKMMLFLMLSVILFASVSCDKDDSTSPEEPQAGIVYINKSESYPKGVDTVFVAPGKQVLLVAGTLKPVNTPRYNWISQNPNIIKVQPVANDTSQAYAIALGDSGQATSITVKDIANNAEKTIYAQILNWPDLTQFTYVDKLNGHYYFISKVKGTWIGAKLLCEENGGHLVTITSEEENAVVRKAALLKKDYIWLGLTYTLPQDQREIAWGAKEWITSEPVVYTNWRKDYPKKILAFELLEYAAMNIIGEWENLGHIVHFCVLEIE